MFNPLLDRVIIIVGIICVIWLVKYCLEFSARINEDPGLMDKEDPARERIGMVGEWNEMIFRGKRYRIEDKSKPPYSKWGEWKFYMYPSGRLVTSDCDPRPYDLVNEFERRCKLMKADKLSKVARERFANEI